ncbi:RES family NAD+ phosphorylase [Vibrio vulnificus]|uniref:RES family NAD+ phosphorylase n=1 Tax=Vibrio vulnificus TaxID=672 RepID=UPI0040582DE6
MGLNNDESLKGHRLINTKYPTIDLFEDVASQDEFEALYEIQALTNPRLRAEVGCMDTISPDQFPYECTRGRSYAIAPFTHINPNGGRFNDGLHGALYIADEDHTAVMEVQYHQQKYWSNIEGLEYDRFLFRGLIVKFSPEPIHIVKVTDAEILNPTSYAASQQLARNLKEKNFQAIQYPSVRSKGNQCWALLTPKPVKDICQSYLIEMIWDGEKIAEVNRVQSAL